MYDFDPPENFKFPNVAELALEFKKHLESFGYHPFVKTTGRKGLHVLTPIEPKWEFQKAFEAAKAVAEMLGVAKGRAYDVGLGLKKKAAGN